MEWEGEARLRLCERAGETRLGTGGGVSSAGGGGWVTRRVGIIISSPAAASDWLRDDALRSVDRRQDSHL